MNVLGGLGKVINSLWIPQSLCETIEARCDSEFRILWLSEKLYGAYTVFYTIPSEGLWVASHKHIARYMSILSGVKAMKYFIPFYYFYWIIFNHMDIIHFIYPSTPFNGHSACCQLVLLWTFIYIYFCQHVYICWGALLVELDSEFMFNFLWSCQIIFPKWLCVPFYILHVLCCILPSSAWGF